MRALFALVVLVLLPRSVWADPPVPTIPPGDDVIVPIQEGEKAPISGHIFSTPTALRWANWLEMYKARLKLDVDKEKAVCRADIELRDTKLELERAQYKTVVTDLEARLKALEDPPFYQTTGFVFGAGVATTVVVVIATAALVNAVSE